MSAVPPTAADRIRAALRVGADICAIAVALCLVLLLFQKYRQGAPSTPTATVPEKFSIPGVDWRGKSKWVVVVMREDCPPCEQSLGFYRDLASRVGARESSPGLIFLFPTNSVVDPRKFLADVSIASGTALTADFASLGFNATPTLAIVGRTGAVQQHWVGLLPAAEQAQVISAALAPAAP